MKTSATARSRRRPYVSRPSPASPRVLRASGGLEPVTEPEVRVDVGPARRSLFELLADLPDEDVNGPVAVRHPVAPYLLVDLLAGEHLSDRAREQAEHLEL